MKSHPTTDPAALRRAAEARLKARPVFPPPPGEADQRRLQQELEIHQIELELQNEELIAALAEATVAQERYADHFDFAPVGYFNLTADGTILAVNLKGASLLGLERSRLSDRRFGLYVAETSRSDFADFLARVFATGTVQACELELERTSQPPLTGLLEATLSPDGKECRAVLIDITERKQLENTLSQEEHLLHSFMDSIPDSVYFKDAQGHYIRVNQAMSNRFGQSNPAALLGKTDFDFFSEEHARAAYEDEQEIMQTGQPVIRKEEKETWPGRADTWVLTSKTPLRDAGGKIIGISGISVDITKRKQAEEQVHEQARLLDLAHDAIIVLDLADHILYWNKGAECIYGWTAQEATQKKVTELLPLDAIAYGRARQIVFEKAHAREEASVRTKSGQEVLVETDWTLVHDEHGMPKSIMIVSADITEKRRLETQTLRTQRMESVGTLAGGIAHDLNNVLAPLLICVQLLKAKVTDAAGQKLLDTLEANVLRGAKLVKQVLAFGRGIKGDRIPIQPKQVLQEIEQMIHETFPKAVELQTDSAADLWPVTGDATQLYQVLLNLCVNARDAMPGGGTLSIHLENVVLDEIYAARNSEAKPGPYVVINVMDTGTGIPKEIQDKIFDPFFTTKAPGKGTGLGLSTCYSIVKNHGGFINCYSEVGRGSKFEVYLPANTSPAMAASLAKAGAELSPGHGELVLVVDDEEAILKVARNTLEFFGYRVLTAFNGAEAVALYRQHQPDIAVVLTDMAMPVMEGSEAIIALQAINPEIRIIGMSGLDSQSSQSKAKGARRSLKYFIEKPFTTETLLHTLHQVLHQQVATETIALRDDAGV